MLMWEKIALLFLPHNIHTVLSLTFSAFTVEECAKEP